MIFVTVGTHEQQFNRLVEFMDRWAETHNEDVIIQTGFSTYVPVNATWRKLYPYSKMIENVDNARIVITHGGPSSFVMPLQIGKIPIVVPRNHEFGEHVNNHQIDFCRKIEQRQKNIILVENVESLDSIIMKYDATVSSMENLIKSNNSRFCSQFENIVCNILNKR